MPLLKDKKLFLLDMDGTIYIDESLFPATIPFLDAVRAAGGRYLFLTNNSSRSVDAYIAKLARMGIPSVREDFLTSVDALIVDLKRGKPFHKCYAFGTKTFRQQLAEAGIPITDRLEDDIDCLLMGFDTELVFQKIEDACILLNRGVEYISANLDWVCPTWYGSVPDVGAVCDMLRRATGRLPRGIGKPEPAMLHLALERTGYSAAEAIMVGDRLYTDIASGVNAGIDTALVLSGDGTREEAETGPWKPTWIFEDIAALQAAWEEARR